MESKYIQQAEFMISRGYVDQKNTVNQIAEKLRAIDLQNIKPKNDVMTAESVYGKEHAPLIKKKTELMADEQKSMISPGEREAAFIKNKQ